MNVVDVVKNYKVKIININNNENDEPKKINEFNKIIKKIYVINLLEDEIKRNYIIILMKKYNINFTLIVVEKITPQIYDSFLNNSSILISKNELGCCLSHLWCLYHIIQNNHENALIFEDDIILHKNFINEFVMTHKNCTSNNKTLDFMLLGAHDYEFSNKNYRHVKNKLYRPDETSKHLYGAHANYYSLKGAKAMFKIRTSIISFFDKEYILMFHHFNNSSYICYPNLVVANISTSTLNHNHELLSKKEYDYYNKCFVNFNFNDYNFMYINLLDINLLQKEDETLESFIEKCFQNTFKNEADKTSAVNIIKKRINTQFFTLEDIKMILQNSNNDDTK
jgi:GR25 family glycosyltransferase involved in LPS biosynthesis